MVFQFWSLASRGTTYESSVETLKSANLMSGGDDGTLGLLPCAARMGIIIAYIWKGDVKYLKVKEQILCIIIWFKIFFFCLLAVTLLVMYLLPCGRILYQNLIAVRLGNMTCFA